MYDGCSWASENVLMTLTEETLGGPYTQATNHHLHEGDSLCTGL